MLRKMLSLMLCMCMLFTLVVTKHITAYARDYKAEIESKYNIKIEFLGDISSKDGCIKEIERCFSRMPETFVKETISAMNKAGKKITIRVDATRGAYISGSASDGVYNNGVITLYMVSEYVLAHEFGHLLHDVLNAKYGTAKLKSEFTAFNKGYEYGLNPLQSDEIYKDYYNTFISDYGSGSYLEDFADTFAIFIRDKRKMHKLKESNPDTGYIKKMQYLETVIKSIMPTTAKENFWIDPSIQLPSEWAKESIEKASDLELIPKDFSGRYQYNITRLEFCKLLVNYLQVKLGREGFIELYNKLGLQEKIGKLVGFTFPAYDKNFPLLDAQLEFDIRFLYHSGIINGKSDNFFDNEGFVTREEAAVILTKTFNLMSIAEKQTVDVIIFEDNDKISDWAKSYVGIAFANGIMNGWDNKFNPKGFMTCEQAYITILNLYEI